MIDLAVCAIVRNEARNLPEWIAFHQLVGVQRFFIYDNGSNDDTRELLRGYPDVQRLTWPGERQQLSAYAHACTMLSGIARWVAFIDVDEFLFSPALVPVPTILRRYGSAASAIGVCWAVFGTSLVPFRGESVIRSFVMRAELAHPMNRHVKSIVRPDRVAGARPARPLADPHHFPVLTLDEHGRPFAGPFAPIPSWDVLRINHYWSKSEEEARVKARTPRADNAELRDVNVLLSDEFNREVDRTIQAYDELLEQRLVYEGRGVGR